MLLLEVICLIQNQPKFHGQILVLIDNASKAVGGKLEASCTGIDYGIDTTIQWIIDLGYQYFFFNIIDIVHVYYFNCNFVVIIRYISISNHD